MFEHRPLVGYTQTSLKKWVTFMNYWLLALTFLSVNLDFFFILLFLLKRYRVPQVMLGYLLGTVILMSMSFAIGKALAAFLPEWLLGILGFLPIWMAIHDDD